MLKVSNLPIEEQNIETVNTTVKPQEDAKSTTKPTVAKNLDDRPPNDIASATLTSPDAVAAAIAEQTDDPLEEIYTWVDQISFSRPRKNIARDFSDAVFMAELLKRYYPRHVDLHNYVPRNAVGKKIENWSTLDRKVLSKIGLRLNKDTILKLAYSEAGAIETVLAEVRKKVLKDCNAERASLYFDYEDNRKGETAESILNREEVTNKKVPRRAFVKLKNELQEKKSHIATLKERVSHLESLVKLKDQRIADLASQIKDFAGKNLTQIARTESARKKY
ncbi:sperm flagellar protein 1-like [Venturia canescens]|uniref:sperm flagellar protein 1-like n=1 Tax=Venturia canescens TaxID=32260 RepID=UPI001C9BDA8B|nr:sperm flagellar protein 1-like [Venturia canescens]